MDRFTSAYIETALWSSTLPPYGECPLCMADDAVIDKISVLDRWSTDNLFEKEHVCSNCSGRFTDYDPPAEDNYSVSDFAPATLDAIVADCAKFQSDNDLSEGRIERAGYDFWLTRNYHGSGFWDGDWPLTGDTLTAASKDYGTFNLYVGDDGLIYPH